MMDFEWDEVKNLSNIQKHGVSFEIARGIFESTILTSIDDRRDYGEVRHISVGRVDDRTVLVVAHTEREGTIRLISARRASRKERRRYEDQNQQST